MVKLGTHEFWIDKEGRICIECVLCDVITHNMIEHFTKCHAAHPVAQRLLKTWKEFEDAAKGQ